MTLSERRRLDELLTKLLNTAHKAGNTTMFVKTWRLLHELGNRVVDMDTGFIIVSPN